MVQLNEWKVIWLFHYYTADIMWLNEYVVRYSEHGHWEWISGLSKSTLRLLTALWCSAKRFLSHLNQCIISSSSVLCWCNILYPWEPDSLGVMDGALHVCGCEQSARQHAYITALQTPQLSITFTLSGWWTQGPLSSLSLIFISSVILPRSL